MISEYAAFIFLLVCLLIILGFLLKEKSVNKLSILFVFLYLISATCSLCFYSLTDFWGSLYNYNNIKIWPFVYWLILFCFVLYPIYDFDKKGNAKIVYNIKFVNFICILGLFLSIVPFFELLPKLDNIWGRHQTQLYNTIAEIHDTSVKKKDFSDLGSLMRIGVINLYDLSFVLIYPLLKSRKKNKLAVLGLIMVMLTRLMDYIVGVGRTGLYIFIIHMVSIGFIFWPLLLNKERKSIIKIGGVGVALIVSAFFIITIARANIYQEKNDEFTTEQFFIQYAGEGFCNFNNYAFEAKESLGGISTFYLPRIMLGIETPILTRDYLYGTVARLQGIPQNVFYTFIGNFVLDLGPIGAAVVLILFSIGVFYFFRRKWGNIPLRYIFLFSIYIQILEFGMIGYVYSHANGMMLWHYIVWFFIMKKFNT